MTEAPSGGSHGGPALLCAGTERAAAARLADAAAELLADRSAVVLATLRPPPVMGGLDAVMDALYDTHAELRQAARDAVAGVAAAAAEVLEERGIDVTPRVCCDERSAWRVILEVADEIDAGVIVAGTGEGSQAQPAALAGEARALAHRSHRPLLLVPPEAAVAGPGAPAVFAFDGSAHAGHAIRAAVGLLRPRPAVVANAWQTASHAVGVARLAVPDAVAREGAERLDAASRSDAETHADAGATILAAAGWPSDSTALETSRNIPAAIACAAADHDAAIIVTGTRGRSRIAAALLGSTAEGIVRHAGRPVLLVPTPPA
jgi:nucleotide-binding universal stress UspA family protein